MQCKERDSNWNTVRTKGVVVVVYYYCIIDFNSFTAAPTFTLGFDQSDDERSSKQDTVVYNSRLTQNSAFKVCLDSSTFSKEHYSYYSILL